MEAVVSIRPSTYTRSYSTTGTRQESRTLKELESDQWIVIRMDKVFVVNSLYRKTFPFEICKIGP